MSVVRRAALIAAALAIPSAVAAQDPHVLPPVTITAPLPVQPAPVSGDVQRYGLPQTIETVTPKKIDETVNIVDTPDAVKYLPSILVRKRNYGDTQPTMATRTWGINSSARNLVYVDDIPISALISNNNSNGAPRWGLVSPEEIKGLDMLYGPFAASYPGNSIGGVLLISTRMPDKLEATFKQTAALQTYGFYNTYDTYPAFNTAATIGDRIGRVSFFLAANREESFSQPLGFVTNGAAFAAGTTGTIPAANKSGVTTNVVGAGGLLHTIMTNYKAKLALDVTDWLRATYTVGLWDNLSYSTVQTYLRNGQGALTFGGVAGFAQQTSNLYEQHLAHAFTLKTDTRADWDFELVATRYDYLQSISRSPAGVGAGMTYTTNGLIARMDGTGWSTQDAKGIWRPDGPAGKHEVSAGVHHDNYVLNNPTYVAANWLASPDTGTSALSTLGTGKTETWAVWAQHAWRFHPDWKLTLGGRMEWWRAYEGYNLAGATSTTQPEINSANFSPKATLDWQISDAWRTKFSFGQAYRYPTVSELYQIVATGPTFASPNPNLAPENVLSFEWSIERSDRNSRVRLSLFDEETTNTLISQTAPLNGVLTTTFQNVPQTRVRGVELVGELVDWPLKGLSLSNSLTFADSRIVSNPNFQSASGSYSNGMWVPYVPQWRDTLQLLYKPYDDLSLALGGRWQGKMYSTLDNSDYVPGVYGAFDPFFVMDLKVRWKFMDAASAEFGIDNVLDEKYFLFHPFPGRTFIASLKVKL